MKKQLLGVALSALLFATVAEAKFEGGSVGVDVGYKWESLKIKGTTSGKASLSPTAVTPSVKAGYAQMVGSVLIGGDVRVGYGFGSSKAKAVTLNGVAANAKIKQSWMAGLGVSFGSEFANDWLAFVRLGVDYNNYKTGSTAAGAGINSQKFNTWAFVPGLGVKMKIDRDWSVDAMYEYSYAFNAKNISSTAKFDKKPTSNNIKVGVSYYL